VWIDKCKAVSTLQVLQRHALKQRRLARAGLADDVDVGKPVLGLDTNARLSLRKSTRAIFMIPDEDIGLVHHRVRTASR